MKLRHWLVASTLVLLHAPIALAQVPSDVAEPEDTLITWAVAAGLMIIVCITAFLSPKRSHRD